MSQGAEQLHATAGEQITELIKMLSNADEEALQRPCPGREKLGDGTVAAIAETVDPRQVVHRLTATRDDLTRIAQLTDQQLDRVPGKDSFRFCDGERTLEQVVAGLLNHQGHQVRALRAALLPTA